MINLGSNYEISMGDLANKIAILLKKEIHIEGSDERMRPEKSEVERLWAENRKAKTLLDWQPLYDLETGLNETINWFSRPENMEFYKSGLYTI